MNKSPMTARGEEQLRDELRRRKTVDRPRIKNALAEARAHGDLKENAEYHAAREQQGFNEGRIVEIENKLANAQVIDVKEVNANGKIVFGATVCMENTVTGEEMTYAIVGEDEADIKAGKVSINSPIARALIGKAAGEVANVQAPGGDIEYEILGVDYV